MTPRIGAHVSAAGGLKKLLERADALKVEALQLHPSAPQSYRKPTFSDEDTVMFKTALAERGWPAFFHSIYLINLANEDDRLWHASLGTITEYLELAPRLGVTGTITHVGSHRGLGLDAVKPRLEKAAAKLGEALQGTDAGTFIIENTAGGGGTLGRDIEELAWLYQTFAAQLPTAITLDTCHLFAAGVDLTDAKAWETFATAFERQIGFDKVAAVHLNDSKFACGSKRDRHANLGEGEIGLESLGRVLNDPRLAQTVFLLEVPGAGQGPDQENIERAKSLRH